MNDVNCDQVNILRFNLLKLKLQSLIYYRDEAQIFFNFLYFVFMSFMMFELSNNLYCPCPKIEIADKISCLSTNLYDLYIIINSLHNKMEAVW